MSNFSNNQSASEQLDNLFEQADVEESKSCLRCWLDGKDSVHPRENLCQRFCPNCNLSITVCLKHQRTYSPHGAKCRQKGLKPVLRPYLKKHRTISVRAED